MRQSLKHVIALGLLVAGLPIAAGCGGPSTRPTTPGIVTTATSSATSTKYFQGTQWEWVDAQIACYKEYGVEAYRGDENDSPTFVVPDPNFSMELSQELNEKCNALTGLPSPPTVDEDFVRHAYDVKTEQYNCLLEAGFTPAKGPSEETYVDTWLTTGKWHSWDPMGGLEGPEFGAGLNACPRPDDW